MVIRFGSLILIETKFTDSPPFNSAGTVINSPPPWSNRHPI